MFYKLIAIPSVYFEAAALKKQTRKTLEKAEVQTQAERGYIMNIGHQALSKMFGPEIADRVEDSANYTMGCTVLGFVLGVFYLTPLLEITHKADDVAQEVTRYKDFLPKLKERFKVDGEQCINQMLAAMASDKNYFNKGLALINKDTTLHTIYKRLTQNIQPENLHLFESWAGVTCNLYTGAFEMGRGVGMECFSTGATLESTKFLVSNALRAVGVNPVISNWVGSQAGVVVAVVASTEPMVNTVTKKAVPNYVDDPGRVPNIASIRLPMYALGLGSLQTTFNARANEEMFSMLASTESAIETAADESVWVAAAHSFGKFAANMAWTSRFEMMRAQMTQVLAKKLAEHPGPLTWRQEIALYRAHQPESAAAVPRPQRVLRGTTFLASRGARTLMYMTISGGALAVMDGALSTSELIQRLPESHTPAAYAWASLHGLSPHDYPHK